MIKSCAQETGIEPPKLQPTLPSSETIDFTVIFNKNKYDVQFPLDDNIGQLKKHLEDVIGESVFFLYLNLIYITLLSMPFFIILYIYMLVQPKLQSMQS